MTASAYPLSWPDGWPRTPSHRRDTGWKFKKTTFSSAREDLFHELRLLGASSLVISCNLKLRLDGYHYADQAEMKIPDPGVAIYFTLRERPMTMARDYYDNVRANLRSLGLAVEHLRGLERHGGAQMMERAFAGFSALPPPAGNSSTPTINWREELGPLPDLDKADLLVICEARYRSKAKQSHSDAGGSDEAMIRLNLAIKLAREELKP
jgi:hypothetical protein